MRKQNATRARYAVASGTTAVALSHVRRGCHRRLLRTLCGVFEGVEAIVVHGGGIADIAQHFCNKYEILTIKVRGHATSATAAGDFCDGFARQRDWQEHANQFAAQYVQSRHRCSLCGGINICRSLQSLRPDVSAGPWVPRPSSGWCVPLPCWNLEVLFSHDGLEFSCCRR